MKQVYASHCTHNMSQTRSETRNAGQSRVLKHPRGTRTFHIQQVLENALLSHLYFTHRTLVRLARLGGCTTQLNCRGASYANFCNSCFRTMCQHRSDWEFNSSASYASCAPSRLRWLCAESFSLKFRGEFGLRKDYGVLFRTGPFSVPVAWNWARAASTCTTEM